jgi:hypothetical protein
MREEFKSGLFDIIKYFLLLGIASIFVADLLVRGWESGGIVQNSLYAVSALFNVPIVSLYYIFVGVFVGLAAVMVLDSFKRVQGVVLWVGIILSIPLVLVQTQFVDVLLRRATPQTLIIGLVAVLLGGVLGGLRRSNIDPAEQPYEFPAAPRWLFRLLSGVVVVAFLEAHIAYTSPIVVRGGEVLTQRLVINDIVGSNLIFDVVVSVAFLYGLLSITRYTRSDRVFQIGPARSGKSAMFGGLAEGARDIDAAAGLNSNASVSELRRTIQSGEFPDPTQSGEFELLEIEYSTGGLFPRKVSLDSVDYPGDLLDEILGPLIDEDEEQSWDEYQRLKRRQQTYWRIGIVAVLGGVLGVVVLRESIVAVIAVFAIGVTVGAWALRQHRSLDTQVGDTILGGEASSWEEAMWLLQNDPDTDSDRRDRDRMIGAIWDCIRFADTVVLTLPLDDFLAPAVENDTVPEYVEIVTNPGGEKSFPELSSEANQPIRRSMAQDYADGAFYIGGDEERAGTKQYLLWYEQLISEFQSDTEFVLAATKADLATLDYTAGRGVPPEAEYDEFCRHIQETFLNNNHTSGIHDLLPGTRENRIYAVWYVIANPDAAPDELRIDTTQEPTILKGADKLIDRLE